MQGWRRWALMGVALGVIVALLPRWLDGLAIRPADPLGRRAHQGLVPVGPDLTGLNLLRLDFHPDKVTSPLRHGASAELTLDPDLQRATQAVLRRHSVPEAGVVVMDVRTGNVLAYASRVGEGTPFDVNLRAEAPAASIFKIVTAAALLEVPGLSAQTEQCYRGGQSRIVANELLPDPSRDRWCASMAMAMGRSINVVFARLAQRHLTPEGLTEAAGAFGFGAPTPFDIDAEAPGIELPNEPLEFARAAAGFWHTSLSPLAGASMAQALGNAGLMLKPRIVRAVLEGDERAWEAPAAPVPLRRVVSTRAAHELTKMMLQTVASGSAFRTFHDRDGRPFLPKVRIASKTGTLTRHEGNRHYTWFVGFAPADQPEVSIAALVVNTPVWRIKGPELAREVLRAYFAQHGVAGVSPP